MCRAPPHSRPDPRPCFDSKHRVILYPRLRLIRHRSAAPAAEGGPDHDLVASPEAGEARRSDLSKVLRKKKNEGPR